jgi:hypothetical protein
MEFATTLAAFAVAALLFAFASWRAARPADPLKPRLLPWRSLIIVIGAVALFILVHLLNLAGFATGQNQTRAF